ncbi:beta-xylosidase [Pseudozyma hubeiensis SY62]|uniref:Beta-xylosidase n=1 Tax=Pseudozyma hubeiensis (strain SY62) TaxID=1305764 RepID=R9P5V1_PSEHS|nr:beta-xylosidase [Pseudozyma hubeiensis SY62]GAC96726.1 beta-xylosidase [Pseudozyma hubeiensis SY62]
MLSTCPPCCLGLDIALRELPSKSSDNRCKLIGRTPTIFGHFRRVLSATAGDASDIPSCSRAPLYVCAIEKRNRISTTLRNCRTSRLGFAHRVVPSSTALSKCPALHSTDFDDI